MSFTPLPLNERTIEITPPESVNVRPGQHWGRRHGRKARLQHDLEILLMAGRVPKPIPGGSVHVTAIVRYPVRRRRDEGNIRAPLEKALADALVAGGWIPDDTPAHFRFGELGFVVVAGAPALARIRLQWEA